MSRLDEQIQRLKMAFDKGSLSLYLGAGVSVESGLPTWEKLVLSMYFKTNAEIMEESRSNPFPNYLLAISEWLLREGREPLDIIIGRLKRHYQDDDEYFEAIKRTLYAAFYDFGGLPSRSSYHFEKNRTLTAVLKLLAASIPGEKGIKSLISYNYDDLIEQGILVHNESVAKQVRCIFKADQEIKAREIPIYHVHGFIPLDDELPRSAVSELVLSEESYHKAAQDAYYWGNMVQMNTMANQVGLMVGISLSDRNIRRILASLMKTPGTRENYIILKREVPKIPDHDDPEMKLIYQRAMEFMDDFSNAGRKMDNQASSEFLRKIMTIIMNSDEERFRQDFSELGLHLIQVNEYHEIPAILQRIIQP